MSKIVFIEPKAPNLHIFSKFMLPRLGLYILGTLAKQRGWDAEIVYEEMQKIDFSQIESSDLVGISTITSTAPRAYMIADKIRQMGIPVIMGGPHVSFQTEEALGHADFVIRGEG
ncbi:MAG: cobalamin-dependent protein, partial [Candidatus Aminicenantes bacterium]|nr:cobalamin-dependent protein [Candidatus Aminicenantes bacterium]